MQTRLAFHRFGAQDPRRCVIALVEMCYLYRRTINSAASEKDAVNQAVCSRHMMRGR